MGNVSRRNFLKYAGLAGGVAGLAGLAGCSGSGSSSASGSIKIGVSIWSSTDALGKLSVEIIKKAASILGVEVITKDQGHVSEQVTASIEELCAAGCNGIVVCNSADSEMTSAINTCDSNQVYLAQFYRMISKENSADVYAVAEKSQYYVGAVHEDEVGNGEKLIELLTAENANAYTDIQKGARNIKLEAWTVGDATFQERWKGYKSGIEKWNAANPSDQATLSDPQYANTSSTEGANVTQQFYNADATMDALIVAGGGGDPLVGSVGQLKNMGLTGKIRVASTDFLDDLKEQLTTGGMYCESGGHFCDPLYAFLMVYAACSGSETFMPKSGDFGKEIKFPYVFVSSVAEYEDYEKYFVDDAPYTDDEMKDLASKDFDALNTAATSLSIEDVKTRHAK
ncbi:sugar ABC transporter substrate-binding protein [Paratractidigestivibacter sp.]|uniref:sugar ABC transporter substrate-binding protein n=1 Tax=Paratractidigestivibacter sp. TaxID=2847316 RepID=UPI002ABE2B4D|nr:twin-arginine translocation signal domain-containing protein [Paratractidigestivibacter sp.]